MYEAGAVFDLPNRLWCTSTMFISTEVRFELDLLLDHGFVAVSALTMILICFWKFLLIISIYDTLKITYLEYGI